jgi:hypothetical protein
LGLFVKRGLVNGSNSCTIAETLADPRRRCLFM